MLLLLTRNPAPIAPTPPGGVRTARAQFSLLRLLLGRTLMMTGQFRPLTRETAAKANAVIHEMPWSDHARCVWGGG